MAKPLTRAAREERLRKIVIEQIETNPHMREGLAWAAMPQSVLAAEIGVSVRTIYDWTRKPPYQSETALVGGVKYAVLRLLADGEVLIETPTLIANRMRKLIREDYPELHSRLTRQHHGCLIWLAKLWPAGHQVPILRYCLKNWPDFASAAKHLLACEADEKGGEFKEKFYNFPSLTFMRKGYKAGPCVYAMSLQAEGKTVPPDIEKFYASVEHFG